MIRLIVAIDRKSGLAKKGFQPWYLPEDERYFTEKTKSFGGENLIGSTTFKTFQGPLTERKNYVLTRDDTPIEGVELVHNIENFLKTYKGKDLWIVGGTNVFQQVMDLGYADELYITHIDADFGCDQFFPEYNDKFVLSSTSENREENGFTFQYCVYTKH